MNVIVLKTPRPYAFSGNPVNYIFSLTPYSVNETRQDLRLQVSLQMEDQPMSGVWREIKVQTWYPDANGNVAVNIAALADAHLTAFTPKPSLAEGVSVYGQHARFKTAARLLKDGQIITEWTNTNPTTILKGGFAYQENDPHFIERKIIADKHPLHFFTPPEGAGVRYDERKFIFFYHTTAEATFYPYFDYTLPDGTIVSNVQKTGGLILPENSIGCIPVCPQIHGLPTNILNYTVTIKTAADVVAVPPIKFEIDTRTAYSPVQLAYTNSLGGTDTISILGEIDSAAEYRQQDAERIITPNNLAAALLPAPGLSTALETERYTGSTSFFSRQKIDTLRDLLLSKQVRELKLGRYLPVIVNKSAVTFYTSKTQLIGFTLEWQPAYSNEYYTPATGVSAELCPALDYFNVLQVGANRLQVLWAMPHPYYELRLNIDATINSAASERSLYGNAGSQVIEFENPAPSPASLTLHGRVVCNAETEDLGPQSNLTIDIYETLPPVAVDDLFNIPKTGLYEVETSVLENDYDPDGDAIECIPQTSTITSNLFITIDLDAAGKITVYNTNFPGIGYFTGLASFPYTIKNNPDTGDTATATVTLQIADPGSEESATIYAKIVERDRRNSVGWTSAKIYVEFYSDAAGTVKKDVTGFGMEVKVNVNTKVYSPTLSESNQLRTLDASGFEMLIHDGTVFQRTSSGLTTIITFTLVADPKYIII